MRVTYEIPGFLKMMERDNWENGCIGSGTDTVINYPISASTIEELKVKILDFVGASDDAMEVDACDEDGRIDVQKVENDDSYDPTPTEWQEFKEGKRDLWAVTYSCYVEKVTREAIPCSTC